MVRRSHLTSKLGRQGPSRGLTTLVFTDIVRSSEVAVALGDRRWKTLQARHHQIVRRELKRHQGREVDTAGDGFFATFRTPDQGVRGAAAIVQAVRALGLDVRAGVHIGEVELTGEKVSGIAVTTAARVGGLAGAGEVLVSATIVDLVAGSGLTFADLGTKDLKGVPGRWELFSLTAVNGIALRPPLAPEEATEARDRAVPPEAPAPPTRRLNVPIAAAVALLILIAGVAIANRGRSPAPTRQASSTGEGTNYPVVSLDATTGEVVHRVTVDPSNSLGNIVVTPPAGLAHQASAWVMSQGPTSGVYLTKIDRASGRVVDRDPIQALSGVTSDCLTYGAGRVWYAAGQRLESVSSADRPFGIEVRGLDPKTGSIRTIRIDPSASVNSLDDPLDAVNYLKELVFDAGALWLGDTGNGTVYRVDLRTGKVRLNHVASSIDGIAFGEGSLWVVDAVDQSLYRLDPKTGQVQDSLPISGEHRQLSAVAAGGGYVWVTDSGDNAVLRFPLDIAAPGAGASMVSIPVGVFPDAVAYDATTDTVWVANLKDRSVSKVDPGVALNRSTSYPIPATPRSIAVSHGEVWISANVFRV